jgi:hypothetical protein
MKSRTVLLSLLCMGLLAATASAQTPPATATAGKSKLDTSQLATVRLVSSLDANGRSIVVLSGSGISGALARAEGRRETRQ